MKSKAKRLLRLGCAALAVGSVPFLRGFAAGTGGAVDPKPMNADLVASGSCGASANWTLDSDGVLTISGSGSVSSNSTFSSYNSQITSVVIENGITTIAQGIFARNEHIATVSLPNSLECIERYAFYECTGLRSISIPDNCLLQYGVFYGCSGMTSAKLPKYGNVLAGNVIAEQLFMSCTSLTTVTIGYVSAVYNKAFLNCPLETVYYPCDHDIEGIRESFPNSPTFVPYHTLTKTEASDPTCTEEGNIDYWTCGACHKVFSDENGTTEITQEQTVIPAHHTLTKTAAKDVTCTEDGNIDYWTCSVCNTIFSDEEGTNEISQASTVIAAPGHDWSEWATVTEATETTPGEEKRSCGRCHEEESREIPAQPDDYQFTADSGKTWTKGSTDGMVVVIKDMSGDDTQTFGKFVSVSVDGTALTRDTDYTADPGSIKLTLSPDYLSTLDAGEHTLTVELTVTSVTYTFTVANPSSSDTPASGESILLISVSLVLMLLAAGGAAYVLIRRRKTAE